MDSVCERSWNQKEDKPVIVRVKRKVGQSPLDAFWLEINGRPLKKPFLDDLSKLSISDSKEKEDVKPKKVLVQHLETVAESESTIDIIHSFFEPGGNEQSCGKGKLEKRRFAFKKDNRKEQRLNKAVQQQQKAAQNARFEQIWRSRKGNKEDIHDRELHERCSFYDVIRVDAEEKPDNAHEHTSLEDQRMLASFLPLLRENIPTAAEEIEADIRSSHTKEYVYEEYVYDYYAVNQDMDISEDDSSDHQFPLVKVEEEEEFCDGPDESDYDSDDSNAEAHPRNDYPEEISEEEEEEEEEDDDDDDEDEEEKSEASSESSERHVRMVLEDDDECDGYTEDWNGYGESD